MEAYNHNEVLLVNWYFCFLFCIEQERASTVHFSCWRPSRQWLVRMHWREDSGQPEPAPAAQGEPTYVDCGASLCPLKGIFWLQTLPTLTTAMARVLSHWLIPPTTPSCSTPTLRVRGRRVGVLMSGHRAVCLWPTKPWRWWTSMKIWLKSGLLKMWWWRSVDAAKAARAYLCPYYCLFTLC